MSDAMAPFREVLADRHDWIRQYKDRSGKRIAGYFCDYLPEEVFQAAGLVPVRITAGRGNVIAADKYLQSNICSFARRCLDQALEGVYRYLDAVAIPHTCDVITKMYDLWAYRMPYPEFIHYLWVPHKVFDPEAVAVMEGELRRFRKATEDFIGAPISDDSLREAIALYDRDRALLKRVYELRKSSPPLVTGEEAFSIALTALLAPKDLHSQWVEAFLAEREGKGTELGNRPRIVLVASVLDDLDLVRAVEDAGAWVVNEDGCTSTRYFFDLVGTDNDNPIKALTRRYLNKLPCPRSVDSLRPRMNHVLNLVRDWRADGVIFYILRCCDAHLFQYPLLRDRLEKEGVRYLYLQGDQTVGINESIVNRIQALVEVVQT